MTIANLTESLIRQNASLGAFEKGKRLYQSQAVKRIVERGNLIQAEVGSSILYQVQIELDQNGIKSASSNYQGDRTPRENSNQSYCRFTVAALLTCIYQPQLIIKKIPIQTLLAQLNRDQFQTLVENLIKFDQNLLEEIEMAAQFLLEHSNIELDNQQSASEKISEKSSTEINPELTEQLAEEYTEQLIEAIATTVTDAANLTDIIDETDLDLNNIATININLPEPTAQVDLADFLPETIPNLEDMLTEKLKQILPKVFSHLDQEVEQFVSDIGELIPQAKHLQAIELIVPVIDAYINDLDQWDTEDENSELDQRMKQFDLILTEAWLSLIFEQPNLYSELQENIQGNIESWQSKLEELNFEGYLEMSSTALTHGWDYAPLLKVLAGEITDQGAWTGKVPYFGDRLAEIRLRILARFERWQQYLNFAAAEGQVTAYLTMLIQLGEIETALNLSPELISTPSEALAIAQKLATIESDLAIEKSIEIAQLGLKLESSKDKYDLAIWLAEQTEQNTDQDQIDIALAANIFAFNLKPSLTIYRKIIALSNSELKPTLLETLRNQPDSISTMKAQIEIFLAENLYQDAIEVANQISSDYYAFLIKQVMDQVLEIESDWVIQTASQKAEAIMNSAKAKYYEDAIAWLKYVKKAMPAANWHSYRQKLIQTHSRKRKLVELLQKI